MNYFESLIDLLRLEQSYDKEQHETLLLKRNLQERKELGVTWFPVSISQRELGRGDYLTLTVNKTNNLESGHKFRFGMPVSLFSNHDPAVDRINGTVAQVNRETMRISFKLEDLPEWSRNGRIGVDLLFDENAYKEMREALNQANDLAQDTHRGQRIRQLIGQESISPGTVALQEDYVHPALNANQNLAVQRILEAHPVTLLHGPPGTGKTTTLIYAVQALLSQQKKQLLLVAPSNTAVDVLTERLDSEGVSVVRIGNPVKVSEHLQALTLDAKMNTHSANKEVKKLLKQARAYMDMAQKYKRNFGKSEREQRKALLEEARKLRKEVDRIQDFMVEDVLDKVEVITATLVGANHYAIRDRYYETVIIDEAAQALEPACWIPILKGKSIVLAGDHCQLPPTVKSNRNSTVGLYITLFEKLVKLHPQAVSMLNVQYRMHEQIMEYPSQALYGHALKADPSVSARTLLHDASPVLFIDTAGAGLEETQADEAIYNAGEAHFVRMHLRALVQGLQESYPLTDFPSIGIIAPYRRQAAFLKEVLNADEGIKPFLKAIQIHTIDSFQGQEKDIIYISLTRSNAQQQIGFLADVRRMNVAMTRAKKKLVVIGDSSTIGQHPFYRDFLVFVTQLDQYFSVWEWDLGEVL